MPQDILVGETYTFDLHVVAKVNEIETGHGCCLELQLEQRDYSDPRIVVVDLDEIKEARGHCD